MTAAGSVLATLRSRTGLSVREAARRAHVGRRYLKRVERGQATATPAWLGHVADVLADALVEKVVTR